METALKNNTDSGLTATGANSSSPINNQTDSALAAIKKEDLAIEQPSLKAPDNIWSAEFCNESINFKVLLENYALDGRVRTFLDNTVSKRALTEIREKLIYYSITEEQFIEFIVNFAEGLQRSRERFNVSLPEIVLADSSSEFESSIHYSARDQKIRVGLKAIESFITNPISFHLLAFRLEIGDDAYFTGWEEGTHFAQFVSESQQKGISQIELAYANNIYDYLFDTTTNYIAADKFEVFAGFILREEFRKKFSHDPEKLKLSFQQDLYVLEQIKESGVKLDGWAKEIVEAKKTELAEITSKAGQFPDLESANFPKVKNMRHMMIMTRKVATLLVEALVGADQVLEKLTDDLKKIRILAPAFKAIFAIDRFSKTCEQKFADWIRSKLEKD